MLLSSFSRLFCGAISKAIVRASQPVRFKNRMSFIGEYHVLGEWMKDYMKRTEWKEGARCEIRMALTLALSVSFCGGAQRASHEPNRCAPLSIPYPDCNGSRSVILCQRFTPRNLGLACALPSVYRSSCQHGRIPAKNSQQLSPDLIEVSAFIKKKTLLAIGVNLMFSLWGQDSNKWSVIYSSLIETTLTLACLSFLLRPPPDSVVNKWFHDFCPLESQETDVS